MQSEENKIKLPNNFPIGEAFIDCYYGKIRQGKTYTGTAGVWKDLKTGTVVYTSWPIKFDGYDERKIFWYKLLGILGLKQEFLVVPKENLRYVNIMLMTSDEFWDWFSSITDAVVWIDEAQKPFDSYLKTLMESSHRMAIFATGHFNRAIKLCVQRPMQIHISIRANIQRYFKIEKISEGFLWLGPKFKMTEFQELKTMDAVPDETQILDKQGQPTGEYKYAENVWEYRLNKQIAQSYNSKYLRSDIPSSQENLAYLTILKWRERIKLFRKKDTSIISPQNNENLGSIKSD